MLQPSLKQSSKSREKFVIFWFLEDQTASPFETFKAFKQHSGCLKEKVIENNQHGFTKS